MRTYYFTGLLSARFYLLDWFAGRVCARPAHCFALSSLFCCSLLSLFCSAVLLSSLCCSAVLFSALLCSAALLLNC